jgi:beta-glucanase (GH16 family)
MRTTASLLAALATASLHILPTAAQTFTNCNPLTATCPADPALGKSVKIDLSSASDSFNAVGNVGYDSNGASFTVAKSGDSPQLISKWYIMFGKVEVSLKAAPGVGIVSSFVMQSDDLDEIDWEWLGGDNTQVQTNYFGKGQTTTYNRGAFHPDAGNQDGFKTYTIEWTPTQIVWQIDGVTVRTLEPANANNQYPQTPMQIKVGAWSGGDPANSPGTIEWAGGPTDYSKGPFTMQVKSISVSDYSTGTEYKYGDNSGTWQSIIAVGGKVYNGDGSPIESSAPAITSSSSNQPIPFVGGSSSAYTTPTVYPWVPKATTMSTSTVTYTSLPGLPSGWTVTSSGKVVPPSSAPVSKSLLFRVTYALLTFSQSTHPHASSTLSSVVSPQASSSAGASKVITAYDDQGFTSLRTVPAGYTPAPKSYDWRGFLITPSAPAATPSSLTDVLEKNAVASSTIATVAKNTPSASVSASASPSASPSTGDSSRVLFNWSVFAMLAVVSTMLLL